MNTAVITVIKVLKVISQRTNIQLTLGKDPGIAFVEVRSIIQISRWYLFILTPVQELCLSISSVSVSILSLEPPA